MQEQVSLDEGSVLVPTQMRSMMTLMTLFILRENSRSYPNAFAFVFFI